MNELKTPMQPLNIQNIDLNDSVIINENSTGEDYHSGQLIFLCYHVSEFESARTFYMLQACMQGIFFIKPRKFSKVPVVNLVELHCSLHYCNEI